MKYKTGEEFLNKLYTDMYKSDVVMHTKEKTDTKEEAIKKYLDRLEHSHDIASKSEHNLDILKKFYYQKYIIKELPESYIEHQKKMARERGYGYIDVDDEMIEEMLNSVKEDQKKSLDTWIEYFISDDSIYPMWFKNYAFQGMINLGIFDKEKCTFTKRTDKTTAPFIELNREVLSLVYDTLKSEIGENEVTEEYEQALKNGESFKKLYTYYLTKQNYKAKNDETDGIWIKYNQGSDYHILCDTLRGKNTGWCIAGEEVAKGYLANGDFYIYYTKDEDLKYTEPRIAIRMEKDSIAEVRGVGPNQNIESNMIKIADQKLDEFPDKEKYNKKVYNMELLTTIENKANNNEELTKEELIFLYEMDEEIEGFGYSKDPRINEIKQKRDIKKDLACIYDIKPENVGTCITDLRKSLFSNSIYVYCGNLSVFDYKKIDKNKIKKLKKYIGVLDLSGLKTAKDLVLPEEIDGELWLSMLESADGLSLPKKVKSGLYLSSLKSAKGLKLPENIGGDINLHSLSSLENLVLPTKINGDLNLGNLTSVQGSVLPEIINGSLYLNSLENPEGLVLPKIINGNLNLNRLENVDNLIFPDKINGHISLCRLKSAKKLILPKVVNGYLWLDNLTTVDVLVLPEIINGCLYLQNLRAVNDLILPKKVLFDIYLDDINYLNNLVVPESLHDKIILSNPKIRNSITVLSDEEYSDYYDEERNKKENEKVR